MSKVAENKLYQIFTITLKGYSAHKTCVIVDHENETLAYISDISYVNTSRHNLYHTGQHQCRLIQTEVFITSDELKLLLTIKYISSDYEGLSVGNGNISNERNVLNYPEGIANGNEIKVLSDGNMMWLTLTSNDYYNYGYYLGYVEAVNMTIDGKEIHK